MKVQVWSPEDYKRNIQKRFERASKYRALFEPHWKENDAIINNDRTGEQNQFNITFDEITELEGGEVDAGDASIGMNYAFKYLHFFHSQLSSNPPSTIVEPASTDPVDKERADAADRIVRHGMLTMGLQDVVDQQSLAALTYGNGWVKCLWDSNQGKVIHYDKSSGHLVMSGDIDAYSPSTFNVWIDEDAKRFTDVRYIFERKAMDVEDAVAYFPDNEDELRLAHKRRKELFDTRDASTGDVEEDVIEIYEMYEKGMPINAMEGRHCFFLEDYTILGEPGANPHCQAGLPYQLLTYVDVPDQVYGKSRVDYVARLQTMLNALDTSFLDNIQAHHAIRLLVHRDTKLEDESVTDSPRDIIMWDGQHPPHPMNPPQLMGDGWRFREQLVTAIQELYGVNDSMMGIQKREQSSLSQQTSIESGTMMHRRLFKKYAMMIERLYKDYLGLVKKHWTIPREIEVVGREKAFEVAKFQGSDIENGWDLRVSYGTSLPLDPNMKREAILLLQPMLKEAGMSPKQILNMMKLNEIESMHDRMSMAADRQREIFEEMVIKNRAGIATYIAPRPVQEHDGMLEFAYDYIMTAEFRDLEPEIQLLIEKHVEQRESLRSEKAAAGITPTPEVGGGPGALPGSPGVSGAIPPSVATTPIKGI
jgi:hypothetical protein